jgi:hypothetical protein
MAEELRGKLNAWEANHGDAEEAALREGETEITGVLMADADYVSSKAGGDSEKIKLGGYTPSTPKSKIEKLPYDVNAGTDPGTVVCFYKNGIHDVSVVWACVPKKDPPAVFDPSMVYSTSTDKLIIEGLIRDSIYLFYVAVVKTKSNGKLRFILVKEIKIPLLD